MWLLPSVVNIAPNEEIKLVSTASFSLSDIDTCVCMCVCACFFFVPLF